MKTLLVLLLLIPSLSFSHSGGTNQGGCHMNYATAEYHCHNRKQINQVNETEALKAVSSCLTVVVKRLEEKA